MTAKDVTMSAFLSRGILKATFDDEFQSLAGTRVLA